MNTENNSSEELFGFEDVNITEGGNRGKYDHLREKLKKSMLALPADGSKCFNIPAQSIPAKHAAAGLIQQIKEKLSEDTPLIAFKTAVVADMDKKYLGLRVWRIN